MGSIQIRKKIPIYGGSGLEDRHLCAHPGGFEPPTY
jgi:hypothetical protein